MLDNKSSCWFLKLHAPFVAVLGGKFGDICQMTAAFHEIHRISGQKPTVVSSQEFASIYEGVSYVNPIGVPGHWYVELNKMKAIAGVQFHEAVGLQSWHDMNSPEFQSARFPGGIVLQSHGHNFAVDMSKDPHYGASMMRRAGFSWEEALKLRPVFDRRNPTRENELLNRCWPKAIRNKPMLLMTFEGQSSPWGHLPELYRLISPFYRHFHVVDLGKLHCHRVFDMLALMENAAGLITIDTLALHMVAATNLPYIAFTQNGWTGSVPKGNCVLEIKYSQSVQRMGEIPAILEHWKNNVSHSRMVPMESDRSGRKATGGGGAAFLAKAALEGTAH